MTKYKFLATSLALCATFSTASQADTYQWKNDDGVTQIGEIVPPEYAGRIIRHLDNRGRVVRDLSKKNAKSTMQGQTIVEKKAALEQRRQDKSLLNSYSNEHEIDLQRDKNLEPVTAHINGVHVRQKAVQERLDGFHKEAKGKQITDPSLQGDIDKAEKDLASLQHELDTAIKEEKSVKVKYKIRKLRYRELTTGSKN